MQTAVAPFSVDNVSMNLFELTMYEKQLVGSIFGSANPRRDIPRLLRLYQEGQLKLDELVTTTYPIEDINVGYQAMRDGTNIRGMVIYDHSGNGSWANCLGGISSRKRPAPPAISPLRADDVGGQFTNGQRRAPVPALERRYPPWVTGVVRSVVEALVALGGDLSQSRGRRRRRRCTA